MRRAQWPNGGTYRWWRRVGGSGGGGGGGSGGMTGKYHTIRTETTVYKYTVETHAAGLAQIPPLLLLTTRPSPRNRTTLFFRPCFTLFLGFFSRITRDVHEWQEDNDGGNFRVTKESQ